MRLKARVDLNQREIVAKLRELGYTVLHLHQVGKDAPDLLIGYEGIDRLVELKSDKGKLSIGQEGFIESWRGAPVIVAYNIMDIVTHWGLTKSAMKRARAL